MRTDVMRIEIRPLREILPYEKNARKIPQRAIDIVAASLEEYGWQQPIVVDKHGVVVVGHVRRLGALQLGWTEAPVHIADKLTPAQIRAYRLMDNRSHQEADWDLDLLAPEIAELSALSFDLSLTGFNVHELDVLLRNPLDEEKADQAPPLPEVATTLLDDVWLCGEHRVLCGDATSAQDVTRLLGDRKPRLMVTDPPYGISLDSEWRDRAGINKHGPAEASYMKKRSPGHTETTISGDTRADWSGAFELVPSLAIAYVWHASLYTREVLDGLLRIGFLYPQQLIWNKGRAVLTRSLYWFAHEPCWFVRKKNAPWYGKAGENSTIWESPSPKFIMGGSDEPKYNHPTQKPVELMRRPILNHTKRGELVYEPFLGSGTTLAAAELTQRTCLGIEVDPKYCDVVVQRWQSLTSREATLDGDGRTFEQIKVERVGVTA
jgi:DNA modification methylase